jgi:hypothetical protein
MEAAAIAPLFVFLYEMKDNLYEKAVDFYKIDDILHENRLNLYVVNDYLYFFQNNGKV